MASIGDLTATLRANTTDFTAKMDAATASSAKLALSLQDPVAQLRQLGIQAGAASGEMRALLVAQQQSIIEGLKAKGLVIVNGQLAYSATAAAEATTEMAAAQTEASVAGAGFMSNASRLERSLGSLTTRMAGIPMQVGSIGVSLGRSILGTAGALAAVGAISLIFVALSGLIEHLRKAAKAAEESAQRIGDAFKHLTLQNQYDDVNTAATNLKAGEDELKTAIEQTNASLTARRALLARAAAENNKDVFGVTGAQARAQLAALPIDAEHDPQVMALQEKVALLRIANQAAQKELQDAQGKGRGYGSAGDITGPKTPATPFFATGLPLSMADAIQAAYANLQLPGPQTPATPFTNSRDNARQLIADYQRDLNSSELRAVVERSGQTLSGAFAQGLVGGDLAKRLTDGLKRVFEDVIAKLLQDKIFSKLEDALVNALFPPTAATGGGGLLSGLGGAISSIGSGLGLSQRPVSNAVAGGTSLARGGAAPTLIVNASGSMPRALSPVEHSRDAQWLALFAETARVAPSLGIRMGVS